MPTVKKTFPYTKKGRRMANRANKILDALVKKSRTTPRKRIKRRRY